MNGKTKIMNGNKYKGICEYELCEEEKTYIIHNNDDDEYWFCDKHVKWGKLNIPQS